MLAMITEKYGGSIKTFAPLEVNPDRSDVPAVLLEILRRSNGIMETMRNPLTGTYENIGWIVYPLSEIIKWTGFYHEEYGIKGTVFSDDGAGNPYYLKKNGKVYLLDSGEETLVSDSLYEFFQ